MKQSEHVKQMTAGKCSTCEAKVWWVRTERNQRMPVDHKPVERGNLYFSGPGRVAHATSLQRSQSGVPKYVSHFATCPDRKLHRGRSTTNGPDLFAAAGIAVEEKAAPDRRTGV